MPTPTDTGLDEPPIGQTSGEPAVTSTLPSPLQSTPPSGANVWVPDATAVRSVTDALEAARPTWCTRCLSIAAIVWSNVGPGYGIALEVCSPAWWNGESVAS